MSNILYSYNQYVAIWTHAKRYRPKTTQKDQIASLVYITFCLQSNNHLTWFQITTYRPQKKSKIKENYRGCSLYLIRFKVLATF